MPDFLPDRNTLGRRLQVAVPRLLQSAKAFYEWLPDAASKCAENELKLRIENGRLAGVDHPLGSFETHEEFIRTVDELSIWVVFCKPVSALRERPVPIYVVRIHHDNAFFGHSADAPAFERDYTSDAWLSRNILRLGYELAIAATEPDVCAKLAG